jgi:thioredoxin-related protein
MREEVYTDPEVVASLEAWFEVARLNYDDRETTQSYAGRERSEGQLARDLNVYEVPGIVILNPNGDYLLHLTGFIEAPRLLPVLRYIGSEAYRDEAYSEFLERADDPGEISPPQ